MKALTWHLAHGLLLVFLACVVGGTAIGASGVGGAPSPDAAVRWSALLRPAAGSKSLVTVELSGDVQAGWHVYGLKQVPDGPTPLKVQLDANPVARTAGPISGSVPERKFDPSFGRTTEFYSAPFKLYLPVHLTSSTAPLGSRAVSVSVRFQSCNGEVCVPPKTVHLSVAVGAAHG